MLYRTDEHTERFCCSRCPQFHATKQSQKIYTYFFQLCRWYNPPGPDPHRLRKKNRRFELFSFFLGLRALSPPWHVYLFLFWLFWCQIAGLRREQETFAGPGRRKRRRSHRADASDASMTAASAASNNDDGDNNANPEVIIGQDQDNQDWEPKGSGSRRRPGADNLPKAAGSSSSVSYEDDCHDRACAALLKYKRVAGFVTGGGGRGEGKGSTPEDIVLWLDERLLDKNIAPLYRAGLRPDHVSSILEALSHGGGGMRNGEAMFGGLGEASVRKVVVGEATRRDGNERADRTDGGSAGVERVEVEEVSVMSAGPTQTGPWQQK